jgi:hypothetical protein
VTPRARICGGKERERILTLLPPEHGVCSRLIQALSISRKGLATEGAKIAVIFPWATDVLVFRKDTDILLPNALFTHRTGTEQNRPESRSADSLPDPLENAIETITGLCGTNGACWLREKRN